MRFKLFVLMLLIVLFTIFVVQNTSPNIDMDFLFWRIEGIPKIILLIVTLVFGIIMGVLISTFLSRKQLGEKEEKTDLKKENKFRSPQI